MSVYVDDMRAPFGRMLMCHMIADTHEQLVRMADRIGVARHWLQDARNHGEHFDICLSKKARAISFGAIEISWPELGRRALARRGDAGHAAYFTEES